MRRLCLLFCLLLSFTAPAAAHDILDCSPYEYARLLGGHIEAIRLAKPEGLSAELSATLNEIALRQADCAGLAFHGDKGGVVQGPVDIPAGIYRVRFSANYSDATLTIISGQCDPYFYIFSSKPSDVEEQVFKSDGCRALIEVSTGFGDWSLSFLPVT